MSVKHHVALDRARKTAKTLARSGTMTHQQALDQVAREAGYAHWNAMATAMPEASAPVPLLTGPEAVTPPESSGRGPAKLFFEMDTFEYLRKPANEPTLADVEAQARTLMNDPARRTGLKISDWIGRIMREAAGNTPSGPAAKQYGHTIRPLPMDARMIAEALDPRGAPHEGKTLTIRCPLHDDHHPSLIVTGTGQEVRFRCMAGCSHSDIQDRLIARLGEEAAAAISFMKDNDLSKVVGGSAFGEPGIGGAGGAYTLANGKRHALNVLATRMLVDGYPDWIDGHLPRSVATLERMLRSGLAGRFPITVTAPEDRARGLWKFEVAAGHDGGYRILVSIRQGEQPGVNAAHSGRFSVVAAETFEKARQAVDRVLDLTREFTTLDPAERTVNEVRHRREVARNARLRGTVNGWGWWAGPNPEEMTFGGPYKTRAEAISNGNGSCMEEGEHFYVVQARTSDDGEDAYGMVTFEETRGLKRCRAT